MITVCFWLKTQTQTSMCELVLGAKSVIGFSTILYICDELLQAIAHSRLCSLLTVRPCGMNSWWTNPIQSHKIVSKTFTFNRIWNVFFSVLALLDAAIGIIGLWFQWHSHTPMIRLQLWPFRSKSESLLNVVNICWTMSMRCCICLKFSNFVAINSPQISLMKHP